MKDKNKKKIQEILDPAKEEEREYLAVKKTEQQIQDVKDYAESHGKPHSRREFLESGLISFSGVMTMPTLASVLMNMNRAHAEDCPTAAAGPVNSSGLAPFVTLNLAGGASLAANFVPMDQGGQTLNSYSQIGLGDGNVPIVREFGNVPFAGDGIAKLLTGIQNTAAATTLANTAFVAVNVRSRDDSGANMLDASGMVSAAGLVGSELPNLGKKDGLTGNNNQPAYVKPPTPLVVRQFEDIEGSVGVAGPLGQLSQEQKISFFRLIENLSTSQAAKLQNFAGGRTLASLTKCAAGKNVELASKNADQLDVRSNTDASGIWGVNAGSSSRDESVVFGSMVLAALTGKSGPISLEKGGYDYHNKTRTRGDERDMEAGEVIGRVLQTAAVLQQRVFLYVTTDGACRSETSNARDSVWRSDFGEAGCNYMIAYDPTGRPETNGFQLGHFTNGQVVDTGFLTGGNPALASAAVFANYLSFSKQIPLLEKVLSGVFSTADLNTILKFV